MIEQRCSDQHRQLVSTALAEAFAYGYLSEPDYTQRLDLAWQSNSVVQLRSLFGDIQILDPFHPFPAPPKVTPAAIIFVIFWCFSLLSLFTGPSSIAATLIATTSIAAIISLLRHIESWRHWRHSVDLYNSIYVHSPKSSSR